MRRIAGITTPLARSVPSEAELAPAYRQAAENERAAGRAASPTPFRTTPTPRENPMSENARTTTDPTPPRRVLPALGSTPENANAGRLLYRSRRGDQDARAELARRAQANTGGGDAA